MSDNNMPAYQQSSAQDEQNSMGGGGGVHGSGIAGGYEGNQQQGSGGFGGMGQQQQGQPAEKQDWLDKGIEMAGKKAGVNIVRGVP